MPQTFTLIASSTVGSGGTSAITFSSIPTTFTDLCVKLSLRSNRSSAVEGISFRFNADTNGANYVSRRLLGDGSAASSDVNDNQMSLTNGNTATSSTFGNTEIYIPNYLGSTYKSVSVDSVSENNATLAYAILSAGIWNNTSAINSLSFVPQVGTLWNEYSAAYLYGIKKD